MTLMGRYFNLYMLKKGRFKLEPREKVNLDDLSNVELYTLYLLLVQTYDDENGFRHKPTEEEWNDAP